jgi:hypothetical protein
MSRELRDIQRKYLLKFGVTMTIVSALQFSLVQTHILRSARGANIPETFTVSHLLKKDSYL